MSLTMSIPLLALFSTLLIIGVECGTSKHKLNGKNEATVTTSKQKCCAGKAIRDVTTHLTATLFDKDNTRSDFGSKFTKRMEELDKHDGDHKGHILGSVLGGPAETWNLAPQAANVNLKLNNDTSILNTWYNCEHWAQAQLEKKEHLPIKITIKLSYDKAGGCRPTHWSISAKNKEKHGCKAKKIPNGTDPHFGVCQRPRKG